MRFLPPPADSRNWGDFYSGANGLLFSRCQHSLSDTRFGFSDAGVKNLVVAKGLVSEKSHDRPSCIKSRGGDGFRPWQVRQQQSHGPEMEMMNFQDTETGLLHRRAVLFGVHVEDPVQKTPVDGLPQ